MASKLGSGGHGPTVDAVVVSYRSRATLRACVETLSRMPDVAVTVVDNDCPERSPAMVADLPVRVLRAGRNGGFAFGCNLGAAGGSAPYVLLLNPDATIERAALDALLAVLDAEPGVGIVGPRVVGDDGSLQRTQRSFPRLRSTWAQGLFVHRLSGGARWSDEVVWDAAAYDRPASPDWISGSCALVRRSALEEIGGLDAGFFLYCEDIDLCRRLRAAGHDVRFEPGATVRHRGGHSAPRAATQAIYARSRVRYARKHYPAAALPLEVAGIVLGELAHAAVAALRPGGARGHAAAALAALAGVRADPA